MDTERLSNKTKVITAIIAAIAILLPAYWQFVWKPNHSSTQQIIYVGRVIDSKTNISISGVKVSLEFQGAPPIVYTDSEGIYRFPVSFAGHELAGRVRVEATSYEIYDRHITLAPGKTNLEDIRLAPRPPTPSQSELSPTDKSSSPIIAALEARKGKTIRLKLKNGQTLVGITQPYITSVREGFIVFLTHDKSEQLRERFGGQNTWELPKDVTESYIDLIDIDQIESFELVEKRINNFQLVTKGGKKIEPVYNFSLQVSVANTPGRVNVKYWFPDTEKSFELKGLKIKDEVVSLPVTMVFISYAPENRKEAVSVARKLQDYGILPWLDENMIFPGANWQLKIEQAIEKADYFIPILSCQYSNRELHQAMHKQSSLPEDKRFIIPILLDDCDAPYNLKKFSSVKITDGSWLMKLLKAIPHL